MNKYEKKLVDVINKYSLEVELLKSTGATIQAFNLHGVKIKLDKFGMPDTFLMYSEEVKERDAYNCVNSLLHLLNIYISKFNNMTFYEYAILVNKGEYEDKCDMMDKWLVLEEELRDFMKVNFYD